MDSASQNERRKEILQRLKGSGMSRCFFDANKDIIVQESDVVQVKVAFDGPEVTMHSVFPRIGNDVQVLSTVLLFLFGAYLFGFQIGILLAIILGQGIAYFWYKPKCNKLRDRVYSVVKD